jgi:hypothetical protein
MGHFSMKISAPTGSILGGNQQFTDFGIETLQNLIQIYKEDPDLLKRSTDPL